MGEKFSQKSDEEILEWIRKGDTEAMDYILEKYKNLVRMKARKLFLIGGDRDDLIQEGMIGLYKAVRDYDKRRESTFGAFADLCVSRQLYDAIKASNRQKNIPLNTYISFNAPTFDEKRDSLYTNNNENPESLIIDKENVITLEREFGKVLSDFEKEVLALYLEGLKYQEIAQKINREPKSVDNALQRIKTKLSRIYFMKE
ncbi:MAG: RNA polymerase sporulation sigma factor SigH [Velocimicrobium sp.]